jgi:hypothetical protein
VTGVRIEDLVIFRIHHTRAARCGAGHHFSRVEVTSSATDGSILGMRARQTGGTAWRHASQRPGEERGRTRGLPRGVVEVVRLHRRAWSAGSLAGAGRDAI